jgi:hypothetical protein
MGSVFNKETLPTKYTIDPPVGTPAAEEFATKAKKTSQQNVYTISEFSYQCRRANITIMNSKWQNQILLTQLVPAQLTKPIER